MKFEEVLPLLRDGKKFRKLHYCGDEFLSDRYIYVKNNQIILVNECYDVEDYDYRLSSDDILAEDWEIVE
jgi:hypothetical protein